MVLGLERHQVRAVRQEEGWCAPSVGCCRVWARYENAMAERVNGILKEEFFLDGLFVDEAQARAALREAVWL